MADETWLCNHCGRELTPGHKHQCGPLYPCNCGMKFATPDERTIHSSSCPVMATCRKVKELEIEQDRLNKELSETRACLGRETQRLIHERDRYRGALEGRDELLHKIGGILDMVINASDLQASVMSWLPGLLVEVRDIQKPSSAPNVTGG